MVKRAVTENETHINNTCNFRCIYRPKAKALHPCFGNVFSHVNADVSGRHSGLSLTTEWQPEIRLSPGLSRHLHSGGRRGDLHSCRTIMASFPVFQETEGEWASVRTVDILGLRIPAYFTTDPQLLYDFITNFQTKPDEFFIVMWCERLEKTIPLLKGVANWWIMWNYLEVT